MLPAHFDDVDGDISGRENYRIVQNSDSDLVTSCFIRILIGITRNLLLNFVL